MTDDLSRIIERGHVVIDFYRTDGYGGSGSDLWSDGKSDDGGNHGMVRGAAGVV